MEWAAIQKEERMNKKRCMAVFILCMLGVNGYAFQFENYEWNDSLPQLKNEIERRENYIVSVGERTLVYHDKIYQQPCTVGLFFDEQSALLNKIVVTWEDTSVGGRLRERFTTRHGRPHRPNLFAKRYIWKHPSRYDMISLDYTLRNTTLVYYGRGYYKEFQEEDKGNLGNITW